VPKDFLDPVNESPPPASIFPPDPVKDKEERRNKNEEKLDQLIRICQKFFEDYRMDEEEKKKKEIKKKKKDEREKEKNIAFVVAPVPSATTISVNIYPTRPSLTSLMTKRSTLPSTIFLPP